MQNIKFNFPNLKSRQLKELNFGKDSTNLKEKSQESYREIVCTYIIAKAFPTTKQLMVGTTIRPLENVDYIMLNSLCVSSS